MHRLLAHTCTCVCRTCGGSEDLVMMALYPNRLKHTCIAHPGSPEDEEHGEHWRGYISAAQRASRDDVNQLEPIRTII